MPETKQFIVVKGTIQQFGLYQVEKTGYHKSEFTWKNEFRDFVRVNYIGETDILFEHNGILDSGRVESSSKR